MTDSGELDAIGDVVNRLTQRFPAVPSDTVARVVETNYARFEGRPVRDSVPLFVERGAGRELAEFAR